MVTQGDSERVSKGPYEFSVEGMSPIRGRVSDSLENNLISNLSSIGINAEGIEKYLSLDQLVESVQGPYKDINPGSVHAKRVFPFYIESVGEQQTVLAINTGREHPTDARQIKIDLEHLNLEQKVKYLVLDEGKFNQLRDLVLNRERRKTYLGDIDPKRSSQEIYNSIISIAIREAASDIHIEPQSEGAVLRYRIDGELQPRAHLNPETYKQLVGVIKTKSAMDIAEKRFDQDGRINLSDEGELFQGYTLRVSTMPTIHGEKIVLRVLQSADSLLTVKDLGLGGMEDRVKTQIESPYGINLVVGPTGSGKTSTLYAFVQELNNSSRNIISVEDPVEIGITGINQFPVNEKIGMTFSKILRGSLRQDPNVIMIGEVRDKETAQVAVESSLTGHAVFATLHANDTISSLQRLEDLEVDSKKLAPVLRSVLAQRLVRKLTPDRKDFKGRSLIAELLVPNVEIQNMIFDGSRNYWDYIRAARNDKENPLIPLVIAGTYKVKDGLTTMEELKKVILPSDFLIYQKEIDEIFQLQEETENHEAATRVKEQ